ncbi:hypothetical protein B0H19DRAFT_1379026 [Mycena capillaripes]|nr:hypothetical protein B0H19DRAFT_1379026 [Mycena capillaripes]
MAQAAESPSSSSSSSSPSPYHPFFAPLDPAADTILRSTEGTLFCVPAFVLRRTAGYFAATLPSTSTLLTDADAEAEPEPVPLTEPAALLARALSILCGLPPPTSPSEPAAALDFPTAESLLALSERWAAPGLASRVRDAITGPTFLAQPLRLYVLAVRAGWTEEARQAARRTLVLNLYSRDADDEAGEKDQGQGELLRRLPTPDLMSLLRLHRRRRDVLDRLLSGKEGEGHGESEGEEGGVSPQAVSGRCKACGVETDNYLWREYRARIFVEMDKRALGDTVTGAGVDEWREALACWNAKCAGAECGKVIYDRDTILPEIQRCIDRLPDTV